MADDATTRRHMPNSRLTLLLLRCVCGDELAMYESQGSRYEARAWLNAICTLGGTDVRWHLD